MIDPLGPDPNDPASPKRKVGEVVSDFESPGSTARLGPRIRHANYDSPEALVRPEPPAKPITAPKTVSAPDPTPTPRLAAAPSPPAPDAPPTAARASTSHQAPVTGPAPAPEPVSPQQSMTASRAKQVLMPDSASTALARPMPPKPGKLERAIGVAKTVLPLVGNLLPLLEGNVVGAAANLIANRQGHEVNLKPLEEAIAGLQSDQRALAFHASEQKRAIRRLEDEFAAVQEAVQKHAADQVELAEQVLKLTKRLSSFMRIVIILLIVSILFTTVLVVRIAYILRF